MGMETQQRLLVDLDALVDTRMGCFIQHCGAEAAKIDMAAWRTRSSDNMDGVLPGVSHEDWARWYKRRDVTTLSHSFATAFMYKLKGMAAEAVKLKKAQPFLESCTLTINAHPYQLSDPIKHAFTEAISEVVDGVFTVHFVSLPPDILTPRTLTASWEYYCLYDLDAWMKAQHKNLEKDAIPKFAMNAPAIFRGSVPTEADIKELELSNERELFAQFEFAMSATIMLGYMPVDLFSQAH